jgi:hypothetical protein
MYPLEKKTWPVTTSAVRSSTYSAHRSAGIPTPSSLGTRTTSTPGFTIHW